MKNKLNIASIFLVLIILIPQVAFASWWNPLSWFKKKTKIIEPTTVIQIPVEDSSSVTESKVELKEYEDKKPSEPKVIPKTSSKIESNKVTTSPVIPVWDACKNIEGIQTIVPEGKYPENGSCIDMPLPVSVPVQTQNKEDVEKQVQEQQRKEKEVQEQQKIEQIKKECTDPTNELKLDILQAKIDYNQQLKDLNSKFAGTGATDSGVQPYKDAIYREYRSKISSLNLQLEQKQLECSIKYNI